MQISECNPSELSADIEGETPEASVAVSGMLLGRIRPVLMLKTQYLATWSCKARRQNQNIIHEFMKECQTVHLDDIGVGYSKRDDRSLACGRHY
jgi:hypothetical protein